MKTSELLRAAKPYLWGGNGVVQPHQTSYLCVAVECVVRTSVGISGVASPPLRVAGERVALRVRNQLGQHLSFGQYLRGQGVPGRELMPEALQRRRHEWLAELIAEFEAKGD